MQFEGGTSVTLTMHGHSYLEGRSTRIEGSKAKPKARKSRVVRAKTSFIVQADRTNSLSKLVKKENISGKTWL